MQRFYRTKVRVADGETRCPVPRPCKPWNDERARWDQFLTHIVETFTGSDFDSWPADTVGQVWKTYVGPEGEPTGEPRSRATEPETHNREGETPARRPVASLRNDAEIQRGFQFDRSSSTNESS